MSRLTDLISFNEEMVENLEAARTLGHTRLLALAFDPEPPVSWHSFPAEQEMKEFLDSRETAESILFNASVPVIVVNPQDTDETIKAIVDMKRIRMRDGPGYFHEAY